MTRAIATLAYIGLAPRAPGTIGSAAALLLAVLIHGIAGLSALAVAWVALTLLGIWVIAAESRRTGDHDASEIVIDELSGQWLAALPALALAPGQIWPLLAAFALFRLFDITKPGPIGTADQWHSPVGVMLDDILAGIAAAVLLTPVLLLA